MPKPKRIIRPFAKEPGFTPFDNFVIDHIMPELSGSAWKVLSYFLRRTLGWQKSGDSISYSQIAKGTGIKSDTTIKKALTVLIERRYIVRRPPEAEWDTAFYFLNTDFEVDPGAEEAAPAASKKSGGLAPESGAASLQKVERQAAPLAPESGDTIKRGSEKETYTHGARPRSLSLAAAAPPESAAAGVGVGSSKSRFSFEQRKAYAERHGLGGGWLNSSRDGRSDEMIADELARTSPEAVERALTTPARTLKPYSAALLHVRSVASFGGDGSDPAAEIGRLFESGQIDEATRDRLLAFDWTARPQASAGGQAA